MTPVLVKRLSKRSNKLGEARHSNFYKHERTEHDEELSTRKVKCDHEYPA